MSSLYKDAIADARKLRETAEQNAKNRIIEAVTPKLRKLIERQIAEGSDVVDDDLDTGFLDSPDAMDLLDDEESESFDAPAAEPMATMPEPIDVESDGLASIEVVPDKEDSIEAKEYEDESQNKSVHVNITVESRNQLLRHRAIRLVKALSEAKTRKQRNKIRKQLKVLREALIITENRQNKRLANNLSVILKESNTMRRRRRNSWLFEGDEPEASEELDLGSDDGDAGGDSIEDMSLSDLLSMAADKAEDLEEGGSDDDDLDMDDDDDDALDLGDETYESMGEQDEMGDESDEEDCADEIKESDELDQCESDEKDEADEIVEISESMLRRALRGTRRSSRRVNESRRARIARARRRRRLAEAEAREAAANFGGGKAEAEMFVDVDENTLLNALAEELGDGANSTAAQGSAPAVAGHYGGGSVEKGAVMEARRHSRTRRNLREAKRAAQKNARVARAAKAELKESNLFNAKLLYVTKLMQQHTLNNKQQRAIIEAMDNAKTQREAKLLFTSLNESLNKRSAKLNESKKTINESRTSYSNRSLQSGQAPRNSGVELDRWAVLAGIKK